jgi:hypothetical protein
LSRRFHLSQNVPIATFVRFQAEKCESGHQRCTDVPDEIVRFRVKARQTSTTCNGFNHQTQTQYHGIRQICTRWAMSLNHTRLAIPFLREARDTSHYPAGQRAEPLRCHRPPAAGINDGTLKVGTSTKWYFRPI